MDEQEVEKPRSLELFTLGYSVFVAGLCSIVYELLIATTASYFLGDSVKFFSLTIGIYMASMGFGAFVSKYIRGPILTYFVAAEVALGLLGGISIPLLYFAYSHTESFIPVYVFFTFAIGLLIGLEIPFLTRLLQGYTSLRINIAHVLSLDYFGALIATAAFPLLLLPFFGIFKSGLVLGLVNMSIGLLILWTFPARIGRSNVRRFLVLSSLIAVLIAGGLYFSNRLLDIWDSTVYEARILYATQTRYQKIVLTKDREDVRLYLDGNLQFSALDEHRYHEALVHVPLALKPDAAHILFLGGGDGLAVREALKHPGVETVTLVDLDAEVVRLARTNPYVKALNRGSLTDDPRVRVVIGDAFGYLQDHDRIYDLIIADLPDPNNTELARLYTTGFYKLVKRNLDPNGLFVTQATSPFYARDAFWGIRATVAAVFDHTRPYHALVPSFGDWGFVIASSQPIEPEGIDPVFDIDTRFLDANIFKGLFVFPRDLGPTSVQPSTLDRPRVLDYYLSGWRHWGR